MIESFTKIHLLYVFMECWFIRQRDNVDFFLHRNREGKEARIKEIRLLHRSRKSQTHSVICLLKDANNISLQVTSYFCMMTNNKIQTIWTEVVVAYLRYNTVIILSDQFLCNTSLSYSIACEWWPLSGLRFIR